MTQRRHQLIRQGIRELTTQLHCLNTECDKLLRRCNGFDQESGDLGVLVRDSLRACAISHSIRRLEYRLAAARELLTQDAERRFQFRRRLHALENGGRKRYTFWKI